MRNLLHNRRSASTNQKPVEWLQNNGESLWSRWRRRWTQCGLLLGPSKSTTKLQKTVSRSGLRSS